MLDGRQVEEILQTNLAKTVLWQLDTDRASQYYGQIRELKHQVRIEACRQWRRDNKQWQSEYKRLYRSGLRTRKLGTVRFDPSITKQV